MKDFEKLIDYKFNNKHLLQQALTHSSYANEHKGNNIKHNERLEFLGDAVLSIVVADYIYANCPELPEGELTKLRSALVCEKALYKFGKKKCPVNHPSVVSLAIIFFHSFFFTLFIFSFAV